ncbi:hypothetical protein GCM10011359_07750 [Nesterenkonia alkaliphila]|nr:hypothetical protein GCM10011359_07750 [Nesterenkonia alkaliphila]
MRWTSWASGLRIERTMSSNTEKGSKRVRGVLIISNQLLSQKQLITYNGEISATSALSLIENDDAGPAIPTT